MSTFQTMNFQTVFEQQKRHFVSGVTRSYEWRVEQLDRMAGSSRKTSADARQVDAHFTA